MRALTPLMLPTSLQPPLTGPRDGVGVTIHRLAGDDDNKPPATTPKGKTMPASPSQDAILAALKKKSPADVDYIERVTGIKRATLSPTFTLMKARGKIESSPHQRAVYGLPGTDWGTGEAKTKAKPALVSTRKLRAAAPESFAAGVKAREAELEQRERSNGTDLHRIRPISVASEFAKAVAEQEQYMRIHEATALPCRAITTAAGGAIVLRGNTLTAELSAEELSVIRQL